MLLLRVSDKFRVTTAAISALVMEISAEYISFKNVTYVSILNKNVPSWEGARNYKKNSM